MLAALTAAAKAMMASPAGAALAASRQAELDRHVEKVYAESRDGDGSGGWDRFTAVVRVRPPTRTW